jgi:rhodanese-related sulfurtransferase
MTGADLERRLDGGAAEAPCVVDVRSGFEFRRGHVPGAVHVPFWTLPFRTVPFRTVSVRAACSPLPTTRRLVVYCGHGPRAWYAGAWLRWAGFAKVEYLDGHMARWRRDRRPLAAGPDGQ